MSEAYKCDRCEELYEEGQQTFGISFEDTDFLPQSVEVVVSERLDLCPKCVIWALKEALKVAGGK